jgi:hypothetical protein
MNERKGMREEKRMRKEASGKKDKYPHILLYCGV